jgi:hypothetical protein
MSGYTRAGPILNTQELETHRSKRQKRLPVKLAGDEFVFDDDMSYLVGKITPGSLHDWKVQVQQVHILRA